MEIFIYIYRGYNVTRKIAGMLCKEFIIRIICKEMVDGKKNPKILFSKKKMFVNVLILCVVLVILVVEI